MPTTQPRTITSPDGTRHAITWWAVAEGQRFRRQATMRGTWGWDATCTCGWDSRTGGALRTSIQRDVEFHKWDATHS